ncbi:MAG TPA: ATP-binding protein [Chthoniobacterales bacterium]|jgi:two-component system phosphate regulon sensor histidine kinase PhoR|nr:ATP-binding protein [Chthoniobacterales bacterium]
MRLMLWLIVWIGLGSTIALVYVTWRNWIAPWRQIERLVRQISAGERPRTFLVEGGRRARQISLALENIFARHHAIAEEIAQRESGTKTILSAMHDGLLVVDAGGRVVVANETFRKLFSLREISGGTPLLDAVRNAELHQLIAESLRNGETRQSELALTGAQKNSERWLQVSAVPMKNDKIGTDGAVVLLHDITELKRVNEMRSDFVANVSHELRTPLSILRGYIETLLDNPKTSPKELARILQVMERHSKRLGLLLDDLLTLAELESANSNLQLSEVNLSELLGKVVHDWEKKLAEKQLKMSVDVAATVPLIVADETRLEEVLHNLLDNAVKYSREKGEIRLHAVQGDDDEIVLSVSDNGVGIGKNDLPRIFERFYRADKARSPESIRGTGLGLSIVKHIAQRHGGRAEAESEPERGTTIRVILPMAR